MALHDHPAALASLLDDDVETARAVFGCASDFAVSCLERADLLDLDPDRVLALVDMLRVLLAPGGGELGGARFVADWARGAKAALALDPTAPEIPTPAPETVLAKQLATDEPAPAKSELSLHVERTREAKAAAERAAAAKMNADDLRESDGGRRRGRRGKEERGSGEDASRASAGEDSRSVFAVEERAADAAARRRLLSTLASALTDDPEGSPRTATAALGLGLGLGSPPPPPSLGAPASVPLLAPPPPSEAGRLAKDVASYAAESLRAHSRLTRACAETLRRATTGERVGGGAGPEGVAFAIAKTRRVLEALRAAAEATPLVAPAAARDAAAAALLLGRALGDVAAKESAGDASILPADAQASNASTAAAAPGGSFASTNAAAAVLGVEEACDALAACAGRALAEHPAMLARFHARLAATLLARPFASIPPLAPPPNDPGASASGGALLDAGGALRASAVARAAREFAPWAPQTAAALRLSEDEGDRSDAVFSSADAGEVSGGGEDDRAGPDGAGARRSAAARASSFPISAADVRLVEHHAGAPGTDPLPPSGATLDRLLSALVATLASIRRSDAAASSPIAMRVDRLRERAEHAERWEKTDRSFSDSREGAARALAGRVAAILRRGPRSSPMRRHHADVIVAIACELDPGVAQGGPAAHSKSGGGGGGAPGLRRNAGSFPRAGGVRRRELVAALALMTRSAFGEATGAGPSLRGAAIPKELRAGFIRRVVTGVAAPPPKLLALAAGWLIAETRDETDLLGADDGAEDDENDGAGERESVAATLWFAALDRVAETGWCELGASPPSQGPKGWYAGGDAAAARERMGVCLLAFHSLPRARRAVAAAAAAKLVAEADGAASARVPRAGAVAAAARAHAALLAAHCVRHFGKCPKWLEADAARVLRGDVNAEGAGGGSGVGALLVALKPAGFGETRARESRSSARGPLGGGAFSGNPFEMDVAAATLGALALGDGASAAAFPSSGSASKLASSAASSPALSRSSSALSLELAGESDRAPSARDPPAVSAATAAYARRAAWSFLAALPSRADVVSERDDDDASGSPSRAFPAVAPQFAPPGTLAFAWGCVEMALVRFRGESIGGSSTDVHSALERASEALLYQGGGVGRDSATRTAMTCAAVHAAARASTLSSGDGDGGGRRLWTTLAATAEALASATRRWTAEALAAKLNASDTRATTLLLSAGLSHADAAPALEKTRGGLAAEVAAILRWDGSWETARDEATGTRSRDDRDDARSPVSSSNDSEDVPRELRAYLDAAGAGDAASALFSCQLALHETLEAARLSAARSDDSAGPSAANAAVAAARLDAVASDATLAFAKPAAEAAASLLGDSIPRGNPEVVEAALGARLSSNPFEPKRGPAAALATLGAGDARAAVDAVLDAAAKAAATGDDAERRDVLRACASLLARDETGGEENESGRSIALGAAASASLLEVFSRSAALYRAPPAGAADEVARWNAARGRNPGASSSGTGTGSDDGAAMVASAVSSADWTTCALLDAARPETDARVAAALARLSLSDDERVADAADDLVEALVERCSAAPEAASALLRACLGRVSETCRSAKNAGGASRRAARLVGVALRRGDEGARLAAETFADVVDVFSESLAAPISDADALESAHAQLRTLAMLLAKGPGKKKRRPGSGSKELEDADEKTLDVARLAVALPVPPRALARSPSRSPSRASETGAGPSSDDSHSRGGETDPDRVGASSSAERRLEAIRAAAAERQTRVASRRGRAGGAPADDPGGGGGDDDDDGGIAALAADAAARASIGIFRHRVAPSADLDLDLALELGFDDGSASRGDAEVEAAIRAATARSNSARSRGSGASSSALGFRLDDENESDLDEEEAAFAAAGGAVLRSREWGGGGSRGSGGSIAERLGFGATSSGGGAAEARRDLNVCTFVSSGSSFMEQHWYFCYTCDLTNSRGCCSACARACHAGHLVVYSRESRFFCDCGAGTVVGAGCRCLTPRAAAAANAAAEALAEESKPPSFPEGASSSRGGTGVGGRRRRDSGGLERSRSRRRRATANGPTSNPTTSLLRRATATRRTASPFRDSSTRSRRRRSKSSARRSRARPASRRP